MRGRPRAAAGRFSASLLALAVCAANAFGCGPKGSPRAVESDGSTLDVEQAPGGFLTFDFESDAPRTPRSAIAADDPLRARFAERAERELGRLRLKGEPLAPVLEGDARLAAAWRRAIDRPLVSQSVRAPKGGYRVVLQADLVEFLHALAQGR